MHSYPHPAEGYGTLIGDTIRLRDDARVRAVDNLGRYKFDRFGYYAARWVTLNQLLAPHGYGESNPFRPLVHKAREMPRDMERELAGMIDGLFVTDTFAGGGGA